MWKEGINFFLYSQMIFLTTRWTALPLQAGGTKAGMNTQCSGMPAKEHMRSSSERGGIGGEVTSRSIRSTNTQPLAANIWDPQSLKQRNLWLGDCLKFSHDAAQCIVSAVTGVTTVHLYTAPVGLPQGHALHFISLLAVSDGKARRIHSELKVMNCDKVIAQVNKDYSALQHISKVVIAS